MNSPCACRRVAHLRGKDMKKSIFVIALFNFLSYGTQETQNLHRYLLANYYQFGQDYKNAGNWYAQIHPNNASIYIYSGYIHYLAATGAHHDIVKLIPELDQTMADHQEIQLLFANALEQTGNKRAAYERLIKLNEKNKANQEFAFRVAQIYLENAEPENALRVIDNVLNSSARRPNNYVFHFLKSQIYLTLNNKKEALACIKQCIEVYPRFDKSWLLYAMLLEQEGKLEEAINGYHHFLEITSEPKSQIERHVMSLSIRHKMELKKDEDDIYNRLIKIQSLAQKSHFGTAAKLLEEWATQSDTQIWLKTLHLLTYIGMPLSTAQATFAAIEKKFPAHESLALYQAELALRMNDHTHILSALQKAYNVCSNPLTKTQIAYQLALKWYERKEWKKASELLQNAHLYYGDYPPSHNLLAYIYGTKTDNFDLANQEIELALKKDPANPHFLDTKAQLLAKQKKYDDALAIWKNITPENMDFTMLCHQGKCQLRAGKKQEASSTIKNAQKLALSKKDKGKIAALLTHASH